MAKNAVFTFKLEEDLRSSFIEETEALDRPSSQVMRELMKRFIDEQREAREYDEFARNKIATARESIQQGRTLTSDEVEAKFSAIRAEREARH